MTWVATIWSRINGGPEVTQLKTTALEWAVIVSVQLFCHSLQKLRKYQPQSEFTGEITGKIIGEIIGDIIGEAICELMGEGICEFIGVNESSDSLMGHMFDNIWSVATKNNKYKN